MPVLAATAGIVFAIGVLALAVSVAAAASGYVWAACAIVVLASATCGVWAYHEAVAFAQSTPADNGRPGGGGGLRVADPAADPGGWS